jgi:predicted transcriptional regulator of viral defense system
MLGNKENEILLFLEDDEIVIFSANDILQRLKERYKYIEVCRALSKLNNSGHIERYEKGKYIKRGFNDQYVIGCHLAEDAVVAYWSALNIHGLTEQFSNTVFLQTTKKKTNKKVFNVDYTFVKVKPAKMVGIENAGYGNHSFRMTDKEKTITDCFDLPEYGGEFFWVTDAFVRNRWDTNRLIQYCIAIGNNAAIKRMGYLAERYQMEIPEFISFAKSKVNGTVNLLNPLGVNRGNIVSKWGLKMNEI